MRTLTTFILVTEQTQDNLEDIADACTRAAVSQGCRDVAVNVAYATPETISDIPSEILIAAIDAGRAIAIAFTDFNLPPGVNEDGEQEIHSSNEGTTQE